MTGALTVASERSEKVLSPQLSYLFTSQEDMIEKVYKIYNSIILDTLKKASQD